MSQTRVLVLLAGAALSIGAPALAQNANLDKDRAYAAELVADAGSRTNALAAAGGASFDKGAFTLSDGTGANTMSIGGSAQFRYNMDFRSNKNKPDKAFTHGFSLGDTRLHTMGNVWSEDLKYKVQGNFNSADPSVPGGGGFGLEDAYVNYAFENGFSLKGGQFRMPLTREWNVEDEYQLSVDRSQSGNYFSSGYTQGLEGGYAADAWRVMFGFTDGFGGPNGAAPSNTPFNSVGEADWAVHGRAEVMFAGTGWDRWRDFTSWKSSDGFAGMVGASLAYQQFGNTGAGGGGPPAKAKEYSYNADVSFEGAGWNAFAAFNGNTIDPKGGQKLNDYGFLVQGGWFVADQWEIFGRYDVIRFDKNRGTLSRTENFVTAGVNYYLSPDSHAAKFTADVVFSANKGGGIPNGRTEILGDADSGEFGVGFQFQIMF